MKLRWQGDSTLWIECEECPKEDVVQQVKSWHGVTILHSNALGSGGPMTPSNGTHPGGSAAEARAPALRRVRFNGPTMTIRQRRMTVLTLGVSALLAMSLYVVALRPPVLIDLHTGPFFHEPKLTVFNPMRDRDPERAAESFLDLLRLGRLDIALSPLASTESNRRTVIEAERTRPVTSWRLDHLGADGTTLLARDIHYFTGDPTTNLLAMGRPAAGPKIGRTGPRRL